jgi:hypothetical protein
MKPSLDADTSRSLFSFTPTPDFAGNSNASTTSAWSFGAPAKQHAPFAPTSLRFSTTPSSFDAATATFGVFPSSSNVKELSGEALENATATDPVALLQDVKVLRLYVEVDEVPFALLDQVYTQAHTAGTLREMQVCIQLSLRPALQDIQNSIGLKRAMRSTMRKWAASNTPLRFFFPLPNVTITDSCNFDD